MRREAMTPGDVSADDRAAQLRAAFDQSFARISIAESTALENLLAIRIGADRYALRLADASGLFADKKVTWLPSPAPELLGVAGFRGVMLPVYDLGMLLGLSKAAAPRWLVVTAATPVGLAFEGFDGFLRVRPEAIVARVRDGARERHVAAFLEAEVARPVIDVASVLATIESRAAHDRLTVQT
jgi:chemotaxis signal transduction protein